MRWLLARVAAILVLLSVTVPQVWGATYHAALSGTPSTNCTNAQDSGTPIRQSTATTTLQTALNCLSPGDTLYLRSGSWGSLVTPTIVLPTGTASQRITIAEFPGDTVTFSVINMHTGSASYLTWDGFTVDGATSSGEGIRCGAVDFHHMRFQNMEVKNAVKHGVLLIGACGGFFEFRNMLVHNNGINTPGAPFPGQNHGYYIQASNNVIEDSTTHSNGGYGAHIFRSGVTNVSNNIVRYSEFYNNDIDDSTSANVLLASGSDNQAYGNIIRDNRYIGLQIGYNCAGCAAWNNLIYSNGSDGISFIGDSTDVQIYNNTVYGNAGVGLFVRSTALDVIARNNILCQNAGGNRNSAAGPGFTGTHNFETNTTCPAQFVNAGARDFRLHTNSTAVRNLGTNTGTIATLVTDDYAGTSRPQGAAYDIGAFELAEGAPSTIEPPIPLLLTYLCNQASNTATMSVLGSLFYVASGATFTGTDLIQASCASSSVMTDVASIVQAGFTSVRPFVFKGTPGPNANNTCTDCLSVHNGAASVNESGSGWTLTDFREGSSLTAAMSGASPYTAMPGLCTRVVAGTVTADPLWPWPMDARIQAARALAGKPAVNITATAESLLGIIPASCVETPEEPGPGQSTWYVATTGVDGGDCSLTSPCATLSHVFGRMTGGNTVYLRAGTYAQRILTSSTPIPGGTSWTAPTVIAAYQQETVVLQVNTNVVSHFNAPGTDRYILLDRLILDGSAATSTTTQGLVVSNGAGPIRFQNGIIRNTYLERVRINSASGVEILNSTITTGTTLTAVRVEGPTNGMVLEGNTVSSSPTLGIAFSTGPHTNARIARNIVRNNGTVGMDLGAGTITALNNLVHSNGTIGVQVRPSCQACQVLNNTIADNTGVELQVDTFTADAVLTNNIAVGGITDNGINTALTTNLTTDPGFVGSGNYRIADPDTSAAVDSGTCLPSTVTVALDGTARPASECDIGAYEQAAAEEPPPPGVLRGQPWQGAGFFFLP